MSRTSSTHGTEPCHCDEPGHQSKFIVLTGGPGAGKTAVIEGLRKSVCQHIALIPEAAGIIFGGGFWRKESVPGKEAAQRAIFHVQNEMEILVREERKSAVAICDRGAMDGLAYWPDSPETFFRQLKITRDELLTRYALVIHLRTPAAHHGYNHQNPMRVETAAEAQAIDDRILKAWEGHSNRIIVESTTHFLEKARRVFAHVEAALPHCCRRRDR